MAWEGDGGELELTGEAPEARCPAEQADSHQNQGEQLQLRDGAPSRPEEGGEREGRCPHEGLARSWGHAVAIVALSFPAGFVGWSRWAGHFTGAQGQAASVANGVERGGQGVVPVGSLLRLKVSFCVPRRKVSSVTYMRLELTSGQSDTVDCRESDGAPEDLLLSYRRT